MATKKELEKLIVSIEADTSKLRRGLKISEGKINKSTKKMAASFKRVGASIATAAASIATMGVAAAAVAVGGFAVLAKRTLENADELVKFSRQVDVSTDFLQEFEFAAERSGVGVDTFRSALEQLQTKTGRAAGEFGTLANDIGKLDPVLLAQIRNAENLEDRFDLILRRVSEYTDVAKRSAVLEGIFGGQGKALARMVGDMTLLRQEARRLGVVIPEDNLKAAEQTLDSITNLTESLKTKFDALVLNPKFQKGIQDLADFLTETITADDFDEKLKAVADRMFEIAKLAGLIADGITKAAIVAGFLERPIPTHFKEVIKDLKETNAELRESKRLLEVFQKDPTAFNSAFGDATFDEIETLEKRLLKLNDVKASPAFQKSLELDSLGRGIDEITSKIRVLQSEIEQQQKSLGQADFLGISGIAEKLLGSVTLSEDLIKDLQSEIRTLETARSEMLKAKQELLKEVTPSTPPSVGATSSTTSPPPPSAGVSVIAPERSSEQLQSLQESIRLIDEETAALSRGKEAFAELQRQRQIATEQESALQSLKSAGLELSSEEIESINQSISARSAAREEANLMTEAQQRLFSLAPSVLTAEQQLAENLRILTEDFTNGRISVDEYSAALGRLAEKENEVKENNSFLGSMRSQLEAARNSGQLAADAIGNIGDNMVDAALDGESFSRAMGAIFQQMIRDILKAIVKQLILRSLLGITGGIGGASSGASIPALAHGGPLASGQLALVGEKGPELFIPKVAGTIIPNNRAGSAGSVIGGSTVNVVVNNNASGAEASVEEGTGSNGERETRVFIENIIANDIARNGPAARAMQQKFGARGVTVR